MKNLLTFILLFFFVNNSLAQDWEGYGDFSSSVTGIFNDLYDNKLYITGNFATIDDSLFNAITYWDGNNMQPMGTGQDFCNPFNCPTVRSIERYQDEIWCSSHIQTFDGIENKGLMKWNGNSWSTFDKRLTRLSNQIGFVRKLIEINDELFIIGGFNFIDSIPIISLAKWDGNSISSLNFPDPFTTTTANLFSIAVYKNEIYIGGNFTATDPSTNEQVHDILRYDGNTWQKVGEGLTGNLLAVDEMIVYKDELYVAGAIYESEGNPGDGILRFDGEEWKDVGGSLNFNAHVHDLLVHDDELYIFGIFDTAGNIPVSNIAKWDGEKWCSFPYTFDNRIWTGEIYDDKLFVGGGFDSINGDAIGDLASISLDLLIPNECDTAFLNSTSIADLQEEISVEVFPNPITNDLNVVIENELLENDIIFTISNLFGRTVHQEQMNFPNKEIEHQLNVSTYPEGVYLLTMQSGNQIVTKKFVINR